MGVYSFYYIYKITNKPQLEHRSDLEWFRVRKIFSCLTNLAEVTSLFEKKIVSNFR